MNKTTEALKLAEKMAKRHGVRMCDENGDTHGEELYCVGIDDIADIIREALAEQEKHRSDSEQLEPVIDLSKIRHEDKCCYWDDEAFCSCGADSHEILKWYRKNNAAQVSAKREWVDLTDDEIDSVLRSYTKTDRYKDDLRSYREVIAAFKEKNK